MNKEIHKQWVFDVITARATGRLSQSQELLNSENKKSAAGILCELYQKITGRGKWVPRTKCWLPLSLECILFEISDRQHCYIGCIPEAIAKWAEFTKEDRVKEIKFNSRIKHSILAEYFIRNWLIFEDFDISEKGPWAVFAGSDIKVEKRPALQVNNFNTTCRKCGAPAYQGFMSIECSNKECK